MNRYKGFVISIIISIVGLTYSSIHVNSKMMITYPKLDPNVKPDSIEALKFCVQTSPSRASKILCIESTIKYCIEHINNAGGTDLNYSECQSRETVLWDQMLNERYVSIIAGFKDDQSKIDTIKSAQKRWIRLRDGYCGLISDMKGSLYYVSNNFSACELRMTANQALNLIALQEDLDL